METKPRAVLRAEAAIHSTAESWLEIRRGFERNERWIVRFGRRSAFVKSATDNETAASLRTELAVYTALDAPFQPKLLGCDESELPTLVLEDVSDGEFPPPWSDAAVAATRKCLSEVATTTPPNGLQHLDLARAAHRHAWERVAMDVDAFLALRACSSAWLERALPLLAAASRAARLTGESLLHGDVRSDNMCIRDGRAILFDWNHACVGNAAFDIAAWLPSLGHEGGPSPQEMLAEPAPEFAALLAGFFASQATFPPRNSPRSLRRLWRAQLSTALAWAASELDLPPLDY